MDETLFLEQHQGALERLAEQLIERGTLTVDASILSE